MYSTAVYTRHATPLPYAPSSPVVPGAPTALLPEYASIQSGAWFADLPEPVRVAIVACARLRRVRAGATLARRGDEPAHWIGVASGALRLGTALSDGRDFTLDFLSPSQWFGDIELMDDRPVELDVTAQVNSTVLLVPRAELRQLVRRFDELGAALLQLNCQRLRHMLRRFEELQTLTLSARLARQLQRLAKQFGRADGAATCIDLAMSQTDLATMIGSSRQRVNRALRQMHARSIVEMQHGRVVVLDAATLDDVATGRLVLGDAAAD